MVAQFLQLKLRLLANALQRSTWRIIGLAVGLVYGLGAATVVVVTLIGLRFADVAIAGSVVTVIGSVLVLGYLAVPLLFGVDDTMDPRSFSLLGIPNRTLTRGLAFAALVSVPSLAVVIIACAQIATWNRGALPVLLALVGAVVIVITCVLGSRVTTSVAAFLLSTRRARDSTATVLLLILILLSPAIALLANVDWRADGLTVLKSIAAFAGWTPFGAVWAAPAAAAAGHPGEALLKLLVGVVFAGVLFLAWRYLVAVMLVTPQRVARGRVYHGLGWFDVFPPTATGVIAARSFTYWGRDSRYFVSLIVVPVVPLMLVVPLLIAGVPAHLLALIPVPVAALFLGWSIHNDVAYDHTAVWLHVVSDTGGRSDRLGRATPALVVGLPVLIVAAVVAARLYGDMTVLPSILGVSLGVLFTGLGLSSIMSARFPYPVVHPGDSPFSQPQSTGTAAAFIQSVSFFATFLLTVPALACAALGLMAGGSWPWLSLAVGSGTGLIVFLVGILWGGHIFEKRSTDLLAFSMRN